MGIIPILQMTESGLKSSVTCALISTDSEYRAGPQKEACSFKIVFSPFGTKALCGVNPQKSGHRGLGGRTLKIHSLQHFVSQLQSGGTEGRQVAYSSGVERN